MDAIILLLVRVFVPAQFCHHVANRIHYTSGKHLYQWNCAHSRDHTKYFVKNLKKSDT